MSQEVMSQEVSVPVTLLPNQGWDPRILVCRYDLVYEDYVLPMHVFVVVSKRYVVLVDTLVNEETAAALLDIARPYLSGRGLLVVNTHADYDHAWGNQLFTQTDGPALAPIIGRRACAQRMRSQEEQLQLARLSREQSETFGGVHLCPPDILFDDELIIDGSDLTLRLFATPGHTPDHCSLNIPEIDTLLAGDAAESPFPSVGESGLVDLRASLTKLAALEARFAFYCHAPVLSGPELIVSNIEYFDALEDRCRAALAEGAQLDPPADADLEVLVGFPYAEAVPSGAEGWAEERYSRPGHHAAISAMLRHVGEA